MGSGVQEQQAPLAQGEVLPRTPSRQSEVSSLLLKKQFLFISLLNTDSIYYAMPLFILVLISKIKICNSFKNYYVTTYLILKNLKRKCNIFKFR